MIDTAEPCDVVFLGRWAVELERAHAQSVLVRGAEHEGVQLGHQASSEPRQHRRPSHQHDVVSQRPSRVHRTLNTKQHLASVVEGRENGRVVRGVESSER